MRTVKWTDANGYKWRSLVRDGDPDEAAKQGILQGPPNLEELDWAAVKRDLHNALVDSGLFSWRDVQEKPGLQGAILTLKRRLVTLYREAEQHE